MKTEAPPWKQEEKAGGTGCVAGRRLGHRRRWERQGVGSRASRA